MQVGPAVRELAVVFIDTLLYVAIYAVTAVGLFGSISLWLALRWWSGSRPYAP